MIKSNSTKNGCQGVPGEIAVVQVKAAAGAFQFIQNFLSSDTTQQHSGCIKGIHLHREVALFTALNLKNICYSYAWEIHCTTIHACCISQNKNGRFCFQALQREISFSLDKRIRQTSKTGQSNPRERAHRPAPSCPDLV